MYIMNMPIFHQGLLPCQLVLPPPGRALPRGLPCVDLLLPRLPCPCLPLHRSYQVPLEERNKKENTVFRYKAVIVLEGFSYILTWILLLWGNGLAEMQVMVLHIF